MLFLLQKFCNIEITPVTLKEKIRLKIFVIGIMRKVLGAKKEELIVILRKLCSKKRIEYRPHQTTSS
jgi:hypothetical protein